METATNHIDEAELIPPEKAPPEALQTAFPKLLRSLGAIVLIASAIAFACQSWSGMNAMNRYYTFYLFSVILTGAGIFCGVRLQEAKGARTFLALATAFLPAHFIQLGAFILHQIIGTPPKLHPFFVLQAASPSQVIVALAIAIPTLSGIAFGGFSALARVRARAMTAVYVVTNLLLLLPTRDADLIGLLSLSLFVAILGFVAQSCADEPLLKNWEGRLAQGLLFLPVGCLMARNVVLYAPTALFVSTLAVAGAVVMLRAARTAKSCQLQLRLQDLGMILGGIASYAFVCGTLFNPRFGAIAEFCLENQRELSLPLAVLPISATMTALSLIVKQRGDRYRLAASWIAILTVLYQLFTVHGILASLLCVLVSVGTIAVAFAIQDRGLLISGSAGFAFGLLYHVRYATTLYAINPWLSLAVPGVMIILSASFVERKYPEILARYAALRSQIERWA